eukprot:Gregarina_sp_Poly_1__7063@NODE_385_length_9010_cov_42_618808_g314_i0_p2_GENE_NODE_385_length_9010_cov_42_618808_g314_i0NODE_385_length_9010_cov_42_618808_g314_i0_p2_ORF_typecomplete_len636_score67_97OSTHTH/PF12872_7/2_4e06zfC3HC4_4/PF15227_6/7_1e05zfC3HC4_3/PF13920_6/0_00042zfC3HC4_2/PF13923_6/0_00062zfC3HC4/PF00097_25/0_0021zfC3HC4/PF00097_25/3_2e03zfRING_5/PF14634_6/7_6e02zfRING_5/PF14634_6/0_012SH3_2/PF07653_17/7_4e03SH3_2/PF07653_17/0_0069zfRING_UBOX/PF13445_6/0_023ProkRING_4/PF14447_6/0_029
MKTMGTSTKRPHFRRSRKHSSRTEDSSSLSGSSLSEYECYRRHKGVKHGFPNLKRNGHLRRENIRDASEYETDSYDSVQPRNRDYARDYLPSRHKETDRTKNRNRDSVRRRRGHRSESTDDYDELEERRRIEKIKYRKQTLGDTHRRSRRTEELKRSEKESELKRKSATRQSEYRRPRHPVVSESPINSSQERESSAERERSRYRRRPQTLFASESSSSRSINQSRRIIPEIVISRLKSLCISGAPQVSELPSLYEKHYGEKLDYAAFGFKKLSIMLTATGVFMIDERKGRSIVLLRDGSGSSLPKRQAEPVKVETTALEHSDANIQKCVGEAHMVYPIVQLVCPACGWLAYKPRLVSCGNYYCSDCLEKILANNKKEGTQCLTCRDTISLTIDVEVQDTDSKDIRSVKRKLAEFIWRLPVKCLYAPKCRWRGILCDFWKHKPICTQDPKNKAYKKFQIDYESFSDESSNVDPVFAGKSETAAEATQETKRLVVRFKLLTERLLLLYGCSGERSSTTADLEVLSLISDDSDEFAFDDKESLGLFPVHIGFDPEIDLAFSESDETEFCAEIRDASLTLQKGSDVEVLRHTRNSFFGFCAGQQGSSIGWFPTPCLKDPSESRVEFMRRLLKLNWWSP